MYFFLLSLRTPQLVSSLRLFSDQTPSLPCGKRKKKEKKKGEKKKRERGKKKKRSFKQKGLKP